MARGAAGSSTPGSRLRRRERVSSYLRVELSEHIGEDARVRGVLGRVESRGIRRGVGRGGAADLGVVARREEGAEGREPRRARGGRAREERERREGESARAGRHRAREGRSARTAE